MSNSFSKLTTQGQISVPAKIRRRLGLHPGSTLEWQDDGDRVVVRRAARVTFEQIHQALFAAVPPEHSLQDLKDGVTRYVKNRHARG